VFYCLNYDEVNIKIWYNDFKMIIYCQFAKYKLYVKIISTQNKINKIELSEK